MRRWVWESPDGSEGRKPRCGGQQYIARSVGASGHVLTMARRLRDAGSIPGWGRSPGGGHGHPLQCSCLENSMDRGAWSARL